MVTVCVCILDVAMAVMAVAGGRLARRNWGVVVAMAMLLLCRRSSRVGFRRHGCCASLCARLLDHAVCVGCSACSGEGFWLGSSVLCAMGGMMSVPPLVLILVGLVGTPFSLDGPRRCSSPQAVDFFLLCGATTAPRDSILIAKITSMKERAV